MPSRREFLKMSCGLCVALAGAGVVATSLEGCTGIPLIKSSNIDGKITVPENSFKDNNTYILVRCKNLENDILLVKYSPLKKEYWALLMQCTHQQQPLTVQGQIIHCATHGSEFDMNGKVTKEPALLPLKKYAAIANDGIITIDLNS